MKCINCCVTDASTWTSTARMQKNRHFYTLHVATVPKRWLTYFWMLKASKLISLTKMVTSLSIWQQASMWRILWWRTIKQQTVATTNSYQTKEPKLNSSQRNYPASLKEMMVQIVNLQTWRVWWRIIWKLAATLALLARNRSTSQRVAKSKSWRKTLRG